ncbi:DMT family transporter [Pullulanibacillus sp. KACC 23026]|uniref:DMT family transporter n=1 Tax=Pullulanibacillus sp. KACC 23026 TaxID=3028315 RepID=UPI0023B20543|nr:DMT family transporter [Pullulanibacillus sp. KACC 23026]WEG11977.1 DMT family transporter [Pullulanibacillus sp. KACC 23026]
MKSPTYLKAYIGLFIGIITVSASAILVKLADAPAGITAFYRLFFTVVVMLPLFPRYASTFRRIPMKVWFGSALAGISLALHFILWFRSLDLTSVTSSVVLVTLQPLFAFLGSMIVFKTRHTLGASLGVLFSILGSVLISWGDFELSTVAFWGDALALAACLAVTVYLMIGERIRQDRPLYTYTFIVYCFSMVTLLIYNCLTSQDFFHYPTKDWVLFLLLAIFPTLLGHTIFNGVVKWLGVTTVSMSILGEPIGASILAYFIFGETLSVLQIIGSLIILGGIAVYLIFESRIHRRTNPALDNVTAATK